MRHFLWISILLSLFSCGEAVERKNQTVSERTTRIKVQIHDSLFSDKQEWMKGIETNGVAGSSAQRDLSQVNVDSSTIVKRKFGLDAQGSITDSKIERIHYPLKSHSGGSVDGVFDSGELINITSKFDSGFGYSAIIVDFQDGKIEKIKYQQHFADYIKFSRDYPDSKVVDPEKLTYTDTTYLFELGSIKSSKKYAGKKFVSTEIKEGLIEHLLDCAKKMKDELNYEREFGKK